jgi:hypothetical protein
MMAAEAIMNRVLTMLGIACVLASVAAAATQPSPEDERRDGIRLMRSINNAELRVRQQSGKYVAIAELLEQPMMGGVKPDISVSGTSVTFKGAQIRLALSADGTQYVATVVSGAPNYTAVVTDESGLIYTGTVLK